MRALFRLTVAVLATLTLAACGQAGPKEQVLHIYNWTDYIDPSILTDFTKETGIKVVYDTIDSNEMLETKVLQGNTGYDLVVPSNHNLPRYIQAGAIQPLDKSRLVGLENLDPLVMGYMAAADPGQKYAIPYMWGTMGIGFNPDAVAKRLPGVKVDNWSVVFEPANLARLKDCGVYWLDAAEDMYAVALHHIGKDPNSTAPADIQAATDMMLAARPDIRKFHSSESIEALANGDICMAIGYSGDMLQARDRARDAGNGVVVDYAIPKEGSQVWFDVFVMPKDAPNPEAAYKFLNYMLRPDVIARASNFTQYANANKASTPLVDKSVSGNPNVYPTPEMFKGFFVTTSKNQAQLREMTRQWTRVQTGQ